MIEAELQRGANHTYERVGKGPVIGSAVVHTAAIVLVWLMSAAPAQVPEYDTFLVELISPPAAEMGEPTPPPPEELVITTPFDPVPEPEGAIPEVTVEEEEPVEETPEPEATVTPPDVELVEEQAPATSLDPDPDVATPGEDLNVRIEGVRRDYPEYYDNILRQMDRCFRWRGDPDLRVEIFFVINRDGSVSQVDVLEPSRSVAFDIEAMGAAECAGSNKRLGPLPEALPYDQLPVRFKFEPRSPGDLDLEE